jgi:TolA-binding protein
MADDSLKGRVTRQGEETIGRLAQELLDNPIVSGALSRAFETRERAMRAQELAMGALNLPSAGDLERLTRRVRSVSQRLESIEDGLDRLEGRLSKAGGSGSEQRLDERLEKIEALLERLESDRTARPSAVPPRAARSGAKQARASGAKQARAAKRPAGTARATSKPKRSGPAAG